MFVKGVHLFFLTSKSFHNIVMQLILRGDGVRSILIRAGNDDSWVVYSVAPPQRAIFQVEGVYSVRGVLPAQDQS